MSGALQILKSLELERLKKKYSSFPIHLIPAPKYNDKTANGLTKCICDFINLSGGQAERISNTGRMIDQRQAVTNVLGSTQVIGSAKWIKGTGTNGSADISATIKGRSVKVEVKMKDRQSEAQKDYQKAIEAAGGIYLIARSFEDFYQKYELITK
jgi:hypothetical protein